MDNDTIAAIATTPGEGTIAVIRVSGAAALQIADVVFRCKEPSPSKMAANTFAYGHVIDARGASIDEALILIMRAPRSYTREDSIEIHGHGGSVSARRILRRLLDCGARQADPGEFTRRAFLNGRIDLLQAEAVADLVAAQTTKAADAALKQMDGALSASFQTIYDQAMQIGADAEASLDFADHELPEGLIATMPERLRHLRPAKCWKVDPP